MTTSSLLEQVASLPDAVTVHDLIRLGIYRSAQSAYIARLTNKAPPFHRIPSRGIIYPKKELLDFLAKTYNIQLKPSPSNKTPSISNSKAPTSSQKLSQDST